MDVLFVCLGNICRSPMAEGILKQLYKEHSIAGIVESAGVVDWNVGRSADSRAITIARENGLDISAHRARQIRTEDFDRFEIILAMDKENVRMLGKLAPPESKHKIRLLHDNNDILDPYHGTDADFRNAYRVIRQCVDVLIAK